MPNILGVIPARYHSTRFPGKPLALIEGISMIQRVFNQAKKCSLLDKVIIATDDERIFEHVVGFGGICMMTAKNHLNGTERIAEIALLEKDYKYCVNIQGDEPCIQPQQIDDLISFLINNPQFEVGTQAQKILDNNDYHKSQIVKVLFQKNGLAKSFKRSPLKTQVNYDHYNYGKHIGLYGFKRDTLLKLIKLNPTENELKHNLEQLRWMEHGYKIGVDWTQYHSPSVDLPEDIDNVISHLHHLNKKL